MSRYRTNGDSATAAVLAYLHRSQSRIPSGMISGGQREIYRGAEESTGGKVGGGEEGERERREGAWRVKCLNSCRK